MDFKVKKGVSKQPQIWGLLLTQFIIFIGVVIICMLSLTSHLSIRKILIAAVIIGISYLVLRVLSQRNIVKMLFSDNFPEWLKNDS